MNNLTITIFGDSIAKGLELIDKKPVAMSINAVEIIKKYFNIEIINKSCFGQTITRLAQKKYVDLYINELDKTKKNIVIFCIGGNDCDYDWVQVANSPNENHDCKTPLSIFVSTYVELIKKLKDNGVNIYICALPVISAKKFFANYVSKLVDGKEVMKFFDGDLSNITRHQEKYNNLLKYIADETNSNFIDIRRPFLFVKNIEKYYCDDGIHPNLEGHKLIANEVINYFEKNENNIML